MVSRYNLPCFVNFSLSLLCLIEKPHSLLATRWLPQASPALVCDFNLMKNDMTAMSMLLFNVHFLCFKFSATAIEFKQCLLLFTGSYFCIHYVESSQAENEILVVVTHSHLKLPLCLFVCCSPWMAEIKSSDFLLFSTLCVCVYVMLLEGLNHDDDDDDGYFLQLKKFQKEKK
jgi:hypothetical protein